MALAEPALRQFGFRKLQNLRFRGGSLLGTAIGTALGLGFGIAQDYDFTYPWSNVLQPDRRRQTLVGLPETQNGGANQQYQALRAKTVTKRRNRYNRKHRDCSCCICTRD